MLETLPSGTALLYYHGNVERQYKGSLGVWFISHYNRRQICRDHCNILAQQTITNDAHYNYIGVFVHQSDIAYFIKYILSLLYGRVTV